MLSPHHSTLRRSVCRYVYKHLHSIRRHDKQRGILFFIRAIQAHMSSKHTNIIRYHKTTILKMPSLTYTQLLYRTIECILQNKRTARGYFTLSLSVSILVENGELVKTATFKSQQQLRNPVKMYLVKKGLGFSREN